MLILVTTIPTGIIGVLLNDAVEITNQTLLVPGLCLILTGLLNMICDKTRTGNKTATETTYKEAGIIGVAQGLAVLPGLSRSGCTLTASLVSGFDKEFAIKYSFIASIPAVLGAVVFKLTDFSMDTVTQSQLVNYLVGTIVAAAVGYFAIKVMLIVVRGKKFKIFAYYCFAIGALALISYFVM
jgi:undecaprenyl-diphosphatase